MPEDIDSFYRKYYQQTYAKYGASAKGVDWKDEDAQRISFDYLLRAINFCVDKDKNISILELGCGYGAFFSYLKNNSLYPNYDYYGIDLVHDMIDKAKSAFPEIRDHFFTGNFRQHESGTRYDFIISSGVFNIRGDFSKVIYEKYVFDTISSMYRRASIGIAFNLMTPTPTFKDDKLYYADLNRLFAFMHSNLSRNFIIISSYPLWKVTVGIYK